MELSVTHQRAARVTLTNRGSEFELVRSEEFFHLQKAVTFGSIYCKTHIAYTSVSLHVSGTQHPARDHARIGVLTFPVTQYGHVQALQTGGQVHW